MPVPYSEALYISFSGFSVVTAERHGLFFSLLSIMPVMLF